MVHLYAALITVLHGLLVWRSHVSWESGVYWLLSCQALAWLAWCGLAHTLQHKATLPNYWWVWPLLIAVTALPAMPLLDDDVWRFLWDGWLVTQGQSPYESVPMVALGDVQLPVEMQSVLDRVAYPEAPTVYGPVMQAAFATAAVLAPGQVWVWKLLLSIALLAVLALTKRWLPVQQSWRVMLLAMTPLLHFETGLNAHPDLIAIMLAMAALHCSVERPVIAAILAALACGARVQAWVIIPFLLAAWPWRARFSWALTLGVVYAPFLLRGSATEWDGLREFGRVWEFNSSVVSLLGSTDQARLMGLLLAAVVCAVAWWQWLQGGADLRSIPGVLCYGALLTGSSVFNAWYALWMLPFLLQPGSLWRWAWLGLPAMSYLTCGNLGVDLMNAFAHPAWVRPLEFGLLGVATWLASRSSASLQSSSVSTSRRG